MKLFLNKLILLNFYNFIFCNIYSITNNTNISLSNEIINLYSNSFINNSYKISNISNQYIKYSEIYGDINNMIKTNSFFQNNEYGFYSKKIDSLLINGQNSKYNLYNFYYKMGEYSFISNKINISNINSKKVFDNNQKNKRSLDEKIYDLNKFDCAFEIGQCEYNIESLISGKNYC